MRGRKADPGRIREGGERALAWKLTQGDPPVCPDWIDPDAKSEWSRIVPALAKLGLALDVDVAMLASYCAAYSRWKRCSQSLELEGPTYVTPSGMQHANPLVGIVERAAEEMRRLAQEFGFTPASRARIDAPPPGGQEHDELGEFLGAKPVG